MSRSDRHKAIAHLGMKCLARLGRSLGEKEGKNEIIGISLGYFGNLGHVLGSDDGIWLKDLITETIGDTLGRTLGYEVPWILIGIK
jgi:hypothetical protein